jgi:hypothetical protein
LVANCNMLLVSKYISLPSVHFFLPLTPTFFDTPEKG